MSAECLDRIIYRLKNKQNVLTKTQNPNRIKNGCGHLGLKHCLENYHFN